MERLKNDPLLKNLYNKIHKETKHHGKGKHPLVQADSKIDISFLYNL